MEIKWFKAEGRSKEMVVEYIRHIKNVLEAQSDFLPACMAPTPGIPSGEICTGCLVFTEGRPRMAVCQFCGTKKKDKTCVSRMNNKNRC